MSGGWKRMFLVALLVLEVSFELILADKVTLLIDAGSTECLFYDINYGTSYEIEYQVIRGGNFDISFTILDPTGRILLADMRRSKKIHRLISSTSGPHQFCLDNSFTRFSNKVVYFDVLVTDPLAETTEQPDVTEIPGKEILNIIKLPLEKIRANLYKSIHYQSLFTALEIRDRSILESNFESINFWSAIHLCAMIAAAAINLIVIRRLFGSSAKLRV